MLQENVYLLHVISPVKSSYAYKDKIHKSVEADLAGTRFEVEEEE